MSYFRDIGGAGSPAPVRISFAYLLIAALLPAVEAGAIDPACSGPAGCTGDIGTAGMCGFNEQITRLDDFCVLNNCQDPEVIGEPTFELDPTGPGQFTARMVVEIEAPWNSWANDPDVNPNATPNGTLDVIWYENAEETPEPWTGVPGPVSICEDLRHDRVLTWIQKSVTCSQLKSGSFGVFSLRAMVCGGPCPPPFYPNCGSFCGRWADEGGLEFEVPEEVVEEQCPKKKDPCGPGGCGAGACSYSPSGSGPGARLRYSAGGVGRHSPGSFAWNGRLGRYWSHDYAQRILVDPKPGRYWLITPGAIYRELWDLDGDGQTDTSSPRDFRSTLSITGTGFELRALDGTVDRFDSAGRWIESEDLSGNKKSAVYAGGRLSRVSFPDGRSEDFAYHPDGKLASITETGIDGVTSRTWSYTWNGLDLVRIDRPDGTAQLLSYDDPANPGYLTRAVLHGTDGSLRVEGAWVYNAYGRVVRSWQGDDTPTGIDAVSQYAYLYDNARNPTEVTITDPLGNLTVNSYLRDTSSNVPLLTSTSGGCPTCGAGLNSQRLYDDSANPLKVTRAIDGKGTVTLFGYDANGQLSSKTEALGTPVERTTTYGYDIDQPGLQTVMEQPSTSGAGQRRTVSTRDAAGNVLNRRIEGVENGSAFSLETTTTYNTAGMPLVVDPPGYGTQDRTVMTYHASRGDLLVATVTPPMVGTTTFEYDSLGRTRRVIDPNGTATETTYDPLNRVLATTMKGATAAEDIVTTQTYNPFGDLLRTIMPEGNVLEYGYDAAGRLISIERKPDPATHGERTFYTLNDFGHRVREELQIWNGSSWQTRSDTGFVYSTTCNLEKIVHADGSVTELDYDCDGNLQREWDANHPSNSQQNPPSRSYGYDALDRLGTLTELWGGSGQAPVTTSYEYDVQDHMVKVTDGNATVTRYAYSDRDLMTEEISEFSGITSYAYNEHAQLVSQTDARGISVSRSLDAADRLLFVDYQDDSQDTTYEYDDSALAFSRGRLSRAIREGSAVEYRYDRFGRLVQDGVLAYGYDQNGNRVSIAYPGDVTASYTYDFADREASLSFQDGAATPRSIVSAASYEPSGPVASMTLGNGLDENRSHTSRYFPAEIDVPGRLKWTFSTDAAGNVTSVTDALDPASNRSFTYQDHQYYLAQSSGPWGQLAWSYDRAGNRLSRTRDGSTTSYQYQPNAAGGNSPLLATTSENGAESRYRHDSAGNLTHVSKSDSRTRYTYGPENRLSEIRFDRAEDAAGITDLHYDGRSFMASSIFTPVFGQPGPSSSTRPTYSSDGLLHSRQLDSQASALSPRNAAESSQTDYLFYFGGHPVAQLEKRRLTPPDAPGSTTEALRFLTTDHLGTPVLATDDTGSTVWQGGFEPFGGDYSGARDAGVFLRLPGQWQDETWGFGEPDDDLYYNVHRWYDSGTARYTRPDPLGQQGGPHPYAYAANNPLALQDPLGLKVELWCARVGAGGNSKIRRSVGKSGASHCFVRVRCDCPEEGGPYDLRLEITGRTGFVNSRGEFPATPPTFHVGNAFASIVPFEPSDWNSNDCTMEQCVLDAYSKSKSEGFRYGRPPKGYVLGPNSNTFAVGLIRSCGASRIYLPPGVPPYDIFRAMLSMPAGPIFNPYLF